MKKRFLISSSALLLLSTTALLPPSSVHASEKTSISSTFSSSKPSEVSSLAIPVNNAWDYSVWSKHENGSRLGSLNDARDSLLYLKKVVYLEDKSVMYQFVSDAVSGWVHADGLIQGAQAGGMNMKPVSTAWDFGIWTHFNNGAFVANLNTYRGKNLTVTHMTADSKWASIKDGSRNLGWVSLKGLTKVSSVAYTAVPINNAWDYSVWNKLSNGNRLGSLNHIRNQVLTIKEEAVMNGVPFVHFSSPLMSGWVAKAAILTGVETRNEAVYPVANAWDYGIWSHYQSGSRVDNLNSYRGEKLTAIAKSPDGWVLFQHGKEIIGWVHREGLGAEANQEAYKFKPYSGVPIANAWNYSVWSHHTAGRRLGSMNDYANQLVNVEGESPNGEVVQFKVGGKVIGWVSPWAIVEGGKPSEPPKETPKPVEPPKETPKPVEPPKETPKPVEPPKEIPKPVEPPKEVEEPVKEPEPVVDPGKDTENVNPLSGKSMLIFGTSISRGSGNNGVGYGGIIAKKTMI